MKPPLPSDLMERPPQEAVRLLVHGQVRTLRRAARRFRRGKGEEGEGLHDVRVAIRRLRTTLRAYAPLLGAKRARRARKRLGALMDATGAARDAAVGLARLEGLDHPAGARAQAWLIERWEPVLGRGYRDAHRALDERLRPILRELTAGLSYYGAPVADDRPAPLFLEAAREAITESANTWKEALALAQRSGTDQDIHRARIATKHVRYLLEPLAELHPPFQTLIERLSRVQDELGAAHDRYVFRRHVEEEAQEAPGLLRSELAEIVAG